MSTNSFKKLAISFLVVSSTPFVCADAVTIGRVYPISERDALEEIEAKVAGTDFHTAMSKRRDAWQAMQSVTLPISHNAAVRYVEPIYTAEFDITDQQGKVIYPKGYKYNPLDFVTLPQRIVVIRGEQAEWIKPQLQESDMVLVASGNIDQVKQLLERPVFILDEKTKRRLGLDKAPSIVGQEKNRLIITELAYDDT